MLNAPVLSSERVACFHGCVRNELSALKHRHLCRGPDPDLHHLDHVGEYLTNLFPKRKFRKASPEWVLANCSKTKRTRVANAFINLEANGLTRADVRVRAFIKFEKHREVFFNANLLKAPRLIQHDSFELCALTMQHLMPLEHWLWGSRCFVKNLNSWQRGQRIADMQHWSETIFDLFDYKTYDATQTRDFLKRIVHRFYRDRISSKELDSLLEAQLSWDGRTRHGIRYHGEGTRCSGRYDTSLGNGLGNLGALEYAYRDEPHDIIVEGDDSVVARRKTTRVAPTSSLEKCGLRVEHSHTTELEQVEFCQCRPVSVNGRWRMVRNPERVFHRMPVSEAHKSGPKWLAACALGEFACNTGVPILQELALAYLRDKPRPSKAMVQLYLLRRPGETVPDTLEPFPISIDTRISFENAWGIPVEAQIQLEEQLRRGSLI